jgi:hypothetical protein
MWMLFLSSFINFCLASNLLWSFLCFFYFLAKERAIFLWHGPKWRVEYSTIRTYCVRSVSYYSSSFFLPPKFGRHISRRCFDQTLWNLVGISYSMWSCTFKCWFFSKWLAKFVQPILIFFGLSRSTRCGCCSYQVSSISVWRVTCYDHFCVFSIF